MLHPLPAKLRNNTADPDIYMDSRDLSLSGDESEASESTADFAEAVGSAPNTILDFDIDEGKRKSPGPTPCREPSHGHFSTIPVTTAAPIVPPVSALTALIRAKERNSQEENHLAELYASFSGKGDLKPLHLKIFRPTSAESDRPVDVIVRQDATVAETIGFSLYRYWEDGKKPPLKPEECDVNVWTLRIMEDVGVVDDDFPALERVRPISKFQFDMFALVEATPEQCMSPISSPNLSQTKYDRDSCSTIETPRANHPHKWCVNAFDIPSAARQQPSEHVDPPRVDLCKISALEDQALSLR